MGWLGVRAGARLCVTAECREKAVRVGKGERWQWGSHRPHGFQSSVLPLSAHGLASPVLATAMSAVGTIRAWGGDPTAVFLHFGFVR